MEKLGLPWWNGKGNLRHSEQVHSSPKDRKIERESKRVIVIERECVRL